MGGSGKEYVESFKVREHMFSEKLLYKWRPHIPGRTEPRNISQYR